MNEFWLISAPGDPTCQQTWERMNQLTHKQHGVSDNFKFHMPDLKVTHKKDDFFNVIFWN